jgi:hypothetical protein
MSDEIKQVLENPITTHALLELLIQQGVKLSVDHNKLTHQERVLILKNIIAELEAREALQ